MVDLSLWLSSHFGFMTVLLLVIILSVTIIIANSPFFCYALDNCMHYWLVVVEEFQDRYC